MNEINKNYYRWETETRYYKANLYQDLFNDWILEKTWGSKFNRRGGEQLTFCSSYNDGLAKIKNLDVVRKRRGYEMRIPKTIKEASELLQLRLLDHIIVAENEYYSFNSKGLL